MAKDKARSAYLTVISGDPTKVGEIKPEILKLGASYAAATGRPFYDLSKYKTTPKQATLKRK